MRIRNLALTLLAAALVALASAAEAASIGINFVDDWGSGGGANVTQDAFTIAAANWHNMPPVFNSNGGGGISSNATVALPGGAALSIEWSCENTYSLTGDPPSDGPGEEQLVYGYLDDTSSGYRARVSGFRNSMANYTIRLVASTDGGEGFTDAFVVHGDTTNTVQYLEILNPSLPGIYGVSTPTAAISTSTGNNSVVITGSPRNGTLRSTLAGILIDYALGGSNPPLVEVQPQAPEGTVFAGQAFTLTAVASGSSLLQYQWRQNQSPIAGATSAIYTKSGSASSDSGAYDVIVSNTYGSVTSSIARVTITPMAQPAITKKPVSQTVYAGYPATFSVEATGGQLAYQWSRGTTPLPAATNATLTFATTTTADADTYSVTVKNQIGSASASASLVVKNATPGTYEWQMVQLKPELYFRLSESGAVAQATAANSGSLGTAGTGLYIGNLTQQTGGALAGNGDSAVQFSGGKVAVPYNAALNPAGSFTVECWANPEDIGSGNRVLAASMINGELPDNTADRSGWALRQSGANLEFVIGGTDANPSYTTIVSALGAMAANTWQHYAAVYQSTTLSVTLFVNGVAVTNVTANAPVLPNTAAPILLGDRGYGGWNFKGSLDELALYSSALTSAKLLAHYQAGSNTATAANYPALVVGDGAVDYLRLNDPPLSPAANLAANAGTLGAAWTGTYVDAGSTLGSSLIVKGTAGPRPATFAGFESTNSAAAMTNGWVTAPQLALGNNVTVTCWIKREAISTTGDLSWPAWLGGGGLHLNNGSAANPDAELRYHWNGAKWEWASGLFVQPDVWTFVAMVIEPEQATFYMSDGTSLTTATNITSHAPMIVTSPPGFGGNQPARADRNYIGQLDETAVFYRALTPAEITALFERSLGIGPVPPSDLTVSLSQGEYFLGWTSGVLTECATVAGTYTAVPNATSPYKIPVTPGQKFYRTRSP